jgi:hypothetical protein
MARTSRAGIALAKPMQPTTANIIERFGSEELVLLSRIFDVGHGQMTSENHPLDADKSLLHVRYVVPLMRHRRCAYI